MSPADPYPVLRLLQSHLEARSGRGEKRIWMTGDARQALREMVRMKLRPRPLLAEVTAPAEVPAIAPPREILSKPAISDTVPASADDASWSEPAPVISVPAGAAPEAVGKTAASASAVPLRLLSLEEKQAGLAAVRARALEGTAARALGSLRETMVFAVGPADAEIVFVGEAPGAEEERQGEPFVGPAGQLLTKIIKVMGLDRTEVYLSNICKYRPAKENQGSGNRPPTPEEMEACLEFVREEIRIIKPKVIVSLGATAAAGLLGIESGVMSARGRFYEFEGIPAMVTLHPSYLLHREKDGPEIGNAEKRKVWEDMLQVMERAEFPVSDKQRRFFLPK